MANIAEGFDAGSDAEFIRFLGYSRRSASEVQPHLYIALDQGYIIQNHLQDKLSLQVTGCHGFCEMGPFLLVLPQGAFYTQVRLDDVPRLVAAALAGDYAEKLLYHDPRTGKVYYQRDEIPFFKYQERTLLGMSQKINKIAARSATTA